MTRRQSVSPGGSNAHTGSAPGSRLPSRARQAARLTEECLPVSSASGLRFGLVDRVIGGGPPDYRAQVADLAEQLAASPDYTARVAAKARELAAAEKELPLAAYRHQELAMMSRNFFEVLHLLVQGLTGRGICDQLVLSPRTVASHVRHIFAKLAIPGSDHDNRRVHAVLIYLNNAAVAPPARPGDSLPGKNRPR